MKKDIKRGKSFLIIAAIYLLCALVGVGGYFLIPFGDTHYLLKVLICDVLATITAFIFSLIFDNASVYDPYWSVQPPVILTVSLCLRPFSAAALILFLSVLLWGVRLTVNWAYTFKGLAYEDWRYLSLREKTGRAYPVVNFVGIHLIPTLVVYLTTIPAVYLFYKAPVFNPLSLVFIALVIGGVAFEWIADIQMHAYRKNRNGTFNRNGIWKYSRHPNYLGEITVWWGVALYTLVYFPEAWYLLLAGAVANTLLFIFVSIPLAEKKQSAKQGFADYKRNTHYLLPFYKKQK